MALRNSHKPLQHLSRPDEYDNASKLSDHGSNLSKKEGASAQQSSPLSSAEYFRLSTAVSSTSVGDTHRCLIQHMTAQAQRNGQDSKTELFPFHFCFITPCLRTTH